MDDYWLDYFSSHTKKYNCIILLIVIRMNKTGCPDQIMTR